MRRCGPWMGSVGEVGRVRARDEDQALEFAAREAKMRLVDATDETEETWDLVIRRLGTWSEENTAHSAALPLNAS
ncbi:hypothetical protein PV666_51450 [Streptomyces acidiscabies]|uniref:Uncharacterized protein n=2 Tax=Streptomyces acidiscabies TaxID=42234 RepID=A0ABU4MFA7_9ACTN|nr:hypothetical protein [Streptomyces acidiscabies]